MSEDPPEDLCRRLNDLEATVRGLTQELVEAHERIRQLESTLHDEGPAEPMPPQETESSDEPDSQDEFHIEDDIIVA